MWRELHIMLVLHLNLKNQKNSEDLKSIKKYLKTSDNFKIASWYMPVKNPKAVLILIDGYKSIDGERARMFAHTEYLKSAGYSTLIIDLRSFGESDGKKISLGVNEWRDVEAAYDYLKSLPENINKKIGFLGISMGATVSIVTKGVTGKGDFIIASTPYSSFKSLFDFRLSKMRLPSFLFLPILRIVALFELGFNYGKYTAINMINKVNVPILIISAKQDKIVNLNDAKIIYDKATNPKEYWQSNSPHGVFTHNPQEFKKRVLEFLSKHV
jgi:esterase/lipase